MYKYKPIKNFLSYELRKFFMDIIATKVILIFITIYMTTIYTIQYNMTHNLIIVILVS